MIDIFPVLGPMLRALPAETAHQLALGALAAGVVPGWTGVPNPVLSCRLWGRRFATPIGLAAGFDKDGVAIAHAFRLGFGFVEVGTVTPRPQAGNPRPRLFRLADARAVINRMGFNNQGVARLAARLAAAQPAAGPVFVNIGRNADSPDAIADYVAGAAALAPLAAAVVVNVSSPNTPGLRALQTRDALAPLLAAMNAARGRARPPGAGWTAPPLLVKIAPDLDAEGLAGIVAAVTETGADGLVIANTTLARPPGLTGRHAREPGGLSGRPLFQPSTRLLRDAYALTGGRLPLVGVGGVATAADAYAKIRAGASLVQLYTALVYDGPALIGRITDGLAAQLKADGFTEVRAAVGADHRAPGPPDGADRPNRKAAA